MIVKQLSLIFIAAIVLFFLAYFSQMPASLQSRNSEVDNKTRIEAAGLLIASAPEPSKSEMIQALVDEREKRPELSELILSTLGRHAAQHPITKTLISTILNSTLKNAVKVAALRTLDKGGSRDILAKEYSTLLKSGNSGLRRETIRALMKSCVHEATADILEAISKDDDAETAVALAFNLGATQNNAALWKQLEEIVAKKAPSSLSEFQGLARNISRSLCP